jgi:hypothetical protein
MITNGSFLALFLALAVLVLLAVALLGPADIALAHHGRIGDAFAPLHSITSSVLS